jgi:hypothetical protein
MQRRFDHYLYDRNNSKWPINMLLKVGSGSPLATRKSGIHWHINPEIKVEYIATDERRQNIPWIRVSNKLTGKVTVFHDSSGSQPNNTIASKSPRLMDCMDCHNRPSHDMHSPDYEIDLEISSGAIASTIPEVKQAAVTAMTNTYASYADAVNGIAAAMNGFYIKGFFDNADHDLVMRAVRKHKDCRWILLYIERWLKAPAQLKDGTRVNRDKGYNTPRGCCKSSACESFPPLRE